MPVVVDGRCVLVVDPFRDAAQLHRRLRREGIEPVECRRLAIRRDGTVEIEEAWPSRERRTLPLCGLIALDDGTGAEPRAAGAAMFLSEMVANGPAAAQAALDLLSNVVCAVPAVAVGAGDHQAIPSIVAAMAAGTLADLGAVTPR
jgi:hypothetical protein